MQELIDKDYIKNMLLEWGKELSENPNAESDIQIDMIRQFYNSVSDFPTIEAEPVRHGRWILCEDQHGVDNDNDNYAYFCSQCHYQDVHSKYAKVNFCWNCGARMDGGDENDT